jgi:hypothetical protein
MPRKHGTTLIRFRSQWPNIAVFCPLFSCFVFGFPPALMAGRPVEGVKWGWDLASPHDAGKQAQLKRPPRESTRDRPAAPEASTASSSLQSPLAAPPLRSDAPSRNVRKRGDMPALASEEDRADAMLAFSSGRVRAHHFAGGAAQAYDGHFRTLQVGLRTAAAGS